MVEQGLVFKHYNPASREIDMLPITKDVLFNPDYTYSMLRSVPLGFKGGLDGDTLTKKACNALIRHGVRVYGFENGKTIIRQIRSMADLIMMSDEELLNIDQMGPKRLGLFRRATRELRERFIENQLQHDN
jgi:hypothetical protein